MADKRRYFPFIHFLHNYSLISYTLALVAFITIPIDIICNHQALLDPFKWSFFRNAAYFVLVRPAYALACMLGFLSLCLGHLDFSINLFNSSGFKFLGNFSFIGSLMGPYIINCILQDTEQAQFVTISNLAYLATSHITLTFVVSSGVSFLIEHPIRTLMNVLVIDKISHDYLLREKFRQKVIKKHYDNLIEA